MKKSQNKLAPVTDKGVAPKVNPPSEPKEVVAFVVPADLMDSIVRYLTSKPYIEVGSIIDSIKSRLSPIYKPSEDAKKDPEPQA